MDMIPIQLLKALVVFDENKTLVAAANVLGLTQPGLTKQLQTLESYFPHKLFAADGRAKILTPFGREIVRGLREKLSGVDDVLRQTTAAFSDTRLVHVRFVGRAGVFEQFIDDLKFPGRLSVEDVPNHLVPQLILDQKADMGVSFVEVESANLIATKLYTESFKLLVPKKFRVRSKNFGDLLRELNSLPSLTYKKNDELIEQIYDHYKINTRGQNIRRTIANFRILTEVAEKGIGWTVIPKFYARSSNTMTVIDLPPASYKPRDFYLYYHRTQRSAPWVRPLKDEIKRHFQG